MNATDKAVAATLEQWGVLYSAVCLGERTRDGWKCDAWAVTLGTQQFDYFTGTGNRAPVPFHHRGPKANTEAWHRLEAARKPVAPASASVLHSLILDSSAACETFASWCSDFGLDPDSRKALATYEACQMNADKLRRVFSPAQVETLQELLQDY
jgi:hypothetical protein